MTSKQRRRGIATLNLRISYTTVTTPASRTADKSQDTGKLLSSVFKGLINDYERFLDGNEVIVYYVIKGSMKGQYCLFSSCVDCI